MSAEAPKPAHAHAPPHSHSPHWLRDRLGWKGLVATLAARRVPRRSSLFSVGSVVLFLFLIQAASGLLLLLYYRPDIAHAHASIITMVSEVPYGDLVRGVHRWSADLFIGVLLTHVFVVLVRRSFKAPRELGWFSGHATLIIGIGLAFTGQMLPWSQLAYSQARVGSEIAHYTPLIGGWLRGFLRGGQEVGANTLGHAFGFHVAVLPGLMTIMIGVHLFFLLRAPSDQKHGKKHELAREAETIPVYPDFLVREAAIWMAVLVTVMTLAIFVERPLGEPADASLPSTPDASPPWYFLPVHQIVRIAPKNMLGMDGPRFLVGSAAVLGLIIVALPFIDKRGSKATLWIAWISLAVFILLGTSALR